MLKKQNKKKLYRGRRQPSIYSRTEADVVKKEYKKSLLTIVLILAFVALGYFLFISSTFAVKNIESTTLVYGNNENIQKTISAHKDKLINRNIFLFREKSLQDQILELEGIESVTVIKKYPDAITVQIKEKNPALVWETSGNKYLIDERGVIWGDYDERFKEIPQIVDTKNIPVKIGQKIVLSKFTTFVQELKKDFETYTENKILRIEVADATQEVKVVSEAGWYAYFNTEATAKNQLINLSRIVNEARKTNTKLEYIDLRIENRIFYK